MFEYIKPKNNRITLVFWCAGIPFGLFWIMRESLVAAFALQAYFLTACVFLYYPFNVQLKNVKQSSFWMRLLSIGIVAHIFFLGGLWYLDVTYPIFIIGTGTVCFVGFVVGVIEMIVVGETVDRFKPDDSDNRSKSSSEDD